VKKHLLLMITLALPLAVSAQTVWRCGPDGRSYSSTPCSEGRVVEALQARPSDDLADARHRAAREQQQADAMNRERLAQEARQRGNGMAAIAPQPVLKPAAKLPLRQRATKKHRPSPEDADIWRATAPSTRRAKG